MAALTQSQRVSAAGARYGRSASSPGGLSITSGTNSGFGLDAPLTWVFHDDGVGGGRVHHRAELDPGSGRERHEAVDPEKLPFGLHVQHERLAGQRDSRHLGFHSFGIISQGRHAVVASGGTGDTIAAVPRRAIRPMLTKARWLPLIRNAG